MDGHAEHTTAADRFVIMLEMIQKMAKPIFASLGLQSERMQEYNELVEQLVADLDRELAPNQCSFTIDPFELERLFHRMTPAQRRRLGKAVKAFEDAASQKSTSPSGEEIYQDVVKVNAQLKKIVRVLGRRYF